MKAGWGVDRGVTGEDTVGEVGGRGFEEVVIVVVVVIVSCRAV